MISATEIRLSAMQVILIDLLATQCMIQVQTNPEEAAKKYRERFRNILARSPEPHDPSGPAYSAMVSGEKADAVDDVLERVEATVHLRLAQRARS
jgi:hypothetical protein